MEKNDFQITNDLLDKIVGGKILQIYLQENLRLESCLVIKYVQLVA